MANSSTNMLIENGVVSTNETTRLAMQEIKDQMAITAAFIQSLANVQTVEATYSVVGQFLHEAAVLNWTPPAAAEPIELSPIVDATWAGENYFATLLDTLRAQLQSWTEGTESTGLNPAVEDRLFERARNREHIASRKLVYGAMNQSASRGFRRPPGVMFIEINRALEDERIAVSGASREIAIKQAELEQSNRQFASKLAWDVEDGLIKDSRQGQGQALDMSKNTADNATQRQKIESDTRLGEKRNEIERQSIEQRNQEAMAKHDSDMASVAATNTKTQAEAEADAARNATEMTKATLNYQTELAKILSAAQIAQAQMTAQITAAGLAQLNYSTAVSTNTSTSQSESVVESTSKSTSVSDSRSNSKSESTNHNYNHSD